MQIFSMEHIVQEINFLFVEVQQAAVMKLQIVDVGIANVEMIVPIMGVPLWGCITLFIGGYVSQDLLLRA